MASSELEAAEELVGSGRPRRVVSRALRALPPDELQALLREIESAREDERREVAAMLHDSVGQLLPLASLKLARARAGADATTAQQLDEVARLLREAHRAAISISAQWSARPLAQVAQLGVRRALRELVDGLERDLALRIVLRDDAADVALADEVVARVCRGVRELLCNVARHAGVDEARVCVTSTASALAVAVEDDGRGMDTGRGVQRGIGLRNLEEQLARVGGEMRVTARPGRGSRVELRVPLRDERAGASRDDP